MRFIDLNSDKVFYSPQHQRADDATYFVHYLIQDTGSLVGQCSRVFCFSREVKPSDSEYNDRFKDADKKKRCFLGPYALKIYNVDYGSEYHRLNLIQSIRKCKLSNVLLPTWFAFDRLMPRHLSLLNQVPVVTV